MKNSRPRRALRALLAAAVCLLTLAACREKPLTAEEIYKKESSGVALIMNTYYYSMSVGGMTMYFSGVDSSGRLVGLTSDAREARANASVAFGTGFFITHDGSLLTNRHVVRPEVSGALARRGLAMQIQALRDYIAMLRQQLRSEYEGLMLRRYLSDFDTDPIDQRIEELRETDEEYAAYDRQLAYAEPTDVRVTPVCRIGVALNCDAASRTSDFASASVVRVSGLDNVDLAQVRLDSRKTPKGRYVFHFEGSARGKRTMLETLWKSLRRDTKGRELHAGTQLCMIGFNHGPELAQTPTGIKAQISTGTILQEPDASRLMYSIPLLQGSSGSPVINMYGDVVGVNFAKLEGATTFNFGIPAARAKEFLGIDGDGQ